MSTPARAERVPPAGGGPAPRTEGTAAAAAHPPAEDPRAILPLTQAEGGGRILAIRILILLVLLLAAQGYDGALHAQSHWFILGVYAAGSLGFGLAERHAGRWAAGMAWAGTGLNAGIAVYVIVEHMLAGGAAQGTDGVSRLPAFLLLLQAGMTLRQGHALLFAGIVTAAWSAAFVAAMIDPDLFPGPDANPTAQLIGLASFVAAALVVIDGVTRLRAAVARALRMEHERARLARFVPEAVADDLARDPGAIHRRHACLMVLDIRGFSRLSREHPPEAMVAALLAVRAAAQAAVAGHGGLVDKYVGDAVLVQFVVGSPDAQARAALACARAIRDRIAGLNAARAAAGLFSLRVVVALHAGDLLVGVFDDGVRAEYTVLGPAMNALSRIEARAKAAGLEIAVSGDFLDLLGRPFPAGVRAVPAREAAASGPPALYAITAGPDA